MKKFTVESNYKEMTTVAKELGIKYVGITKEALSEKINEALAAKEEIKTSNKLNFRKEDPTGLVEVGPKGVSNFQMIPAIKANVGNVENLRKLFEAHKEVFISSAKYVGKTAKPVAEAIINGTEIAAVA